ncbi:MAG TPA: ABC transporter substrate-binding protein [Actinomycetota bacterium]|nr:ABC transporter substrate-binding protein [Actinomycetota bacterium]
MRRLSVVAAAMMLFVLAACGGNGDSGSDGEGGTMRFVFSPDPVWNWLEDEGILAEMEEESGFHIERNESEDEFAFFAGGHADIVSTGSYETPVLEAESDVETVTIGKYNKAKDIIIVKADSGYETFDDLEPGCKLGVESFSGSTIVWQALAQDLHGRTIGEGPDDIQMAITDFNTAVDLVQSGELCAGVTSIYNANAALMDGSVAGLYDAKSASQLYGEEYVPGHEGMNSNNFVVLKSWYDEHPEEVAFFLEVWDRGLQEWETNRDAILDAYPEDFGYQTPEELEFLKNWYETQFNEFVDTVYLDETWIEGELQVTDLLADAGLVPEGQEGPIHVCVDPESGEESCSLP